MTSKVGLIFSCDSFYHPRPELLERMAHYGVLAVEMEAAALYTLAAQARPEGTGHLHGLGRHRHRGGGLRPGPAGDVRAHGRGGAHGDGRLSLSTAIQCGSVEFRATTTADSH